MLSRTDTHRAHKMPLLAVAFHFVRKLTCSEPNSGRVCVCVCEPVMGRVDKVNLNSKHNHKPVGPRKLTVNEENEKMFIHPQLFPPAHVCVYSCVCVLYEHSSVAGVCEVTDSFIMAGAHRETAPSRGRREEDRDTGGTGPVYCWAGPRHFSCWWRKGGRRGDSCCLL